MSNDAPDNPLSFTEVFRNILDSNPGHTKDGQEPAYAFTRDDFEIAMELGQFEMFYQPKVRSATRAVEGAEALVRWRHPELGLLTPDKFLPSAESTEFIHELGAWVIRQVTRFNAHVRQNHKKFTGRIALNVSPTQFNNPAYLSAVLKATEQFKFPNHLLEIELTETGVLDDMTQAADLMNMIHSYGISIAIDDFGTGFSSMQSLARLPINTVKLDISFIRDLATSEQNRTIVHNMLGLCKELRLVSVAEGVEQEEQAQVLTDWGCDYLQGYLFSHPLDEDQFIKLIS